MANRFAWGQWFAGMWAAFVGAGSGAVVAGFSTMMVDPSDFNLQNPRKLLETMLIMFFFSGFLAFMNFIHQSPLPTIVTTSTETTVIRKQPPVVVKTTVTETHETPNPPDPVPPKTA